MIWGPLDIMSPLLIGWFMAKQRMLTLQNRMKNVLIYISLESKKRVASILGTGNGGGGGGVEEAKVSTTTKPSTFVCILIDVCIFIYLICPKTSLEGGGGGEQWQYGTPPPFH